MRLKSYLTGALVIVAMGVAGTVPAIAQVPKPKITGLGEGALTVKARSGQDTADAYLTVLNAGNTAANLKITFQAGSSEDVRVTPPGKPIIVGPGAKRVPVRLYGLRALKEKAEGQIVAIGGEAPVARAVEIQPAPQPTHDWVGVLWWGTIAVFVGLLLGMLVRLRLDKNRELKIGNLKKRAPGAKWSFESWATTFTAVGAILGTVIGAVTLPEVPRQVDKDTLVQLNLIFGVLIVVGPFLFQAIRPKVLAPTDKPWLAELTGYAWALLISCSLTCSAVLGELATLGLMGGELTESSTVRWVIAVSAFVLGFLTFSYFWRTVWDLVGSDWEDKAQKAYNAAKQPQEVIIVSGEKAKQMLTDPQVHAGEQAEVDKVPAFIAAPQAPQRLAWDLP